MFSLNRLSRAVCLGLTLSAVTLSGCTGEEVAAPESVSQAQAVTVVTLQPSTVTLTRELPGRIRASLVAEIRPQVSGIVEARMFSEGSLVEAGQPLYQLADAAYRADLNSAEASLARAQATVATARLTAQRATELAKVDAISQQENDNAQAELLQAQADVKVAQAAVASAKVILDYSRITAPVSGYIGRSSVTQGALVTTNQAQPLATVQQFNPIHVDLTQSSSELLALRKAFAAGTLRQTDDLPVIIQFEDGSRYSHAGKLAFSEMIVDPSTGSFSLRVEVPNPERFLLPGMYVRAVLGSGVRRQALLVPQQGVVRDPKGNASVMVVDRNNQVASREVRVSRTVGDQWLVESGLTGGDRVVIEGLQKIKPGMSVRVIEAGKPETVAASEQ